MKLTFSKFLRLLVAVAGIVAFCMMFTTQMNYVTALTTSEIGFETSLFGGKVLGFTYDGAIGSFVGYLLMLVAALGIGLSAFAKPKVGKVISLLGGLIMIVGAILVFVLVPLFLNANGIEGEVTKFFQLATGPMVAGIIGCVAGLVSLVTLIFKK